MLGRNVLGLEQHPVGTVKGSLRVYIGGFGDPVSISADGYYEDA